MDLPPVPCDASVSGPQCRMHVTHVAAREVTALEHEVGDDAVELGAGIAKALLAGGEGAEVFYRLGNDIVKELKVDATRLCCGVCQRYSVDGGVGFAIGVAVGEAIRMETWRGEHGGAVGTATYSSRRPWR
jgi:hypothetical protein